MICVQYDVRPVGWLTCKWLRHFWSGCLRSALNGLSLRESPPPELPGRDWVRLRTRMAGICGTDLAILGQKQPPTSILQGYSSLPMVMGHENVAVVDEVGPDADPAWRGKRVCVEPTLACLQRGLPPCPRCADGQFGACESFGADGVGKYRLPPGTSIGYNRATGGGYGEFFVAHQSQLIEIDQRIPDEQAVLTDPLACALHAVLRADLSRAGRVLVYGLGVIGLGVVAGLRAVGYAGDIDAVEAAPQTAEFARGLGVSEILTLPRGPAMRRGEIIARRTGATVRPSRLGNYMLSGGYDVVFDCVGTARSVTECLKWAAARGQVVMEATGHGGNVDLTPVWFRELTILGAYGRQVETFGGRRIGTYQLVHELMLAGKLPAAGLLTHTFPLRQYKKAFEVSMNKGRFSALKAAFDYR